MNSIKLNNLIQSYISVIVLGIVMCFAFSLIASIAQAEEDETTTDEVSFSDEEKEKRAELLAQIEELRATIQSQKEALKVQRETNKEEIKNQFQENKEEYKSDLVSRRDALMESLVGATPEEKREALLEFMTEVKAELEAKKAEFKENQIDRKEDREDRKEAWKVSQEEFQASLAGLSPAEKVAAILERAQSLSDFLADRLDENDDDLEVSDEKVSIIREVGVCDPVTGEAETDEVGECVDGDEADGKVSDPDQVDDKFITESYPNGG
ncbi:hypothetical protein H6785_04010 [Candidatus Nomurabacteria bacterium]|nr:hypothetical protein [Candidatus Nomurabacteria bacterium]